jgi:hypothetical protein
MVLERRFIRVMVGLRLLIEGDDPRHARMRLAMFCAMVLHLLVVMMMPGLPQLTMPTSNRGSILNVFLGTESEVERFEQELNQPFPFPNSDHALLEPTLGAASPEAGDDGTVSEATEAQVAQQASKLGDRSAGDTSDASIESIMRTDLAFIRMFAQQEAVRHAEEHPEEVERFRRSFNSARNYHRRNKTDSYQNRYGDYYTRTTSSSGDVCFLQRPGENRDELSTNIVYFFRCGAKPVVLDLEANIE